MLGCRGTGAVAVLCCKRSLQHCASAHCCLPLSSSSSGCLDPSSPTSGNWDLFYPSFSSPESFFLPPLHPHILVSERSKAGWGGQRSGLTSSLRSGAGLCCFASARPCSSTWSSALLCQLLSSRSCEAGSTAPGPPGRTQPLLPAASLSLVQRVLSGQHLI